MRTVQVFQFMLAECDPLPAYAAIDLVKDDAAERGEDLDVSSCIVDLYRVAGDYLAEKLGPPLEPPALKDFFAVSEGWSRAAIIDTFYNAWKTANHVVSQIRGSDRPTVQKLIAYDVLLATLPGPEILGNEFTNHFLSFANWPAHVERIDSILMDLQATEKSLLA